MHCTHIQQCVSKTQERTVNHNNGKETRIHYRAPVNILQSGVRTPYVQLSMVLNLDVQLSPKNPP